jgi:hypothetical protein
MVQVDQSVYFFALLPSRKTPPFLRLKNSSASLIRLMDQHIEVFDIAFEGAKLPAYFIAGGEGKRPTLIALGGFASTMEEVYGWIGPVAV